MKKLLKRVLTPVLKAKKRPRGKPFKPGNRVGLATRFRQGVSPNPGGRAKSKEISRAWAVAQNRKRSAAHVGYGWLIERPSPNCWPTSSPKTSRG